jgi:hypothetical protein
VIASREARPVTPRHSPRVPRRPSRTTQTAAGARPCGDPPAATGAVARAACCRRSTSASRSGTRRRSSSRLGHFGLHHPRPAPCALGVAGPLADLSVKFLGQPREFLDRKVINPTNPPAGHDRVHTTSSECCVERVSHGQVIVRSLQRRPPSLAGHPWDHLAPVHRSGVVRSGRVPRGRGLWLSA